MSIAEHGDTQVPVWSLASIAGMRLDDYCLTCRRACSAEEKESIFTQVREAAANIIRLKGATYHAVSLALVRIVESIIGDQNSVLTVSALLEDYHGMSDICLSVPAVVNSRGVDSVIPLTLSAQETASLRRSADTIRRVNRSLGA